MIPEWAEGSPVLAGIWAAIEEFMTEMKAIGVDPEKARAVVIELIQDGLTWDQAARAVRRRAAMGETF